MRGIAEKNLKNFERVIEALREQVRQDMVDTIHPTFLRSQKLDNTLCTKN